MWAPSPLWIRTVRWCSEVVENPQRPHFSREILESSFPIHRTRLRDKYRTGGITSRDFRAVLEKTPGSSRQTWTYSLTVALRARAWIETFPCVACSTSWASPSVRGRGLKHALIELYNSCRRKSPSVRGRGLKRLTADRRIEIFRSPSVRGRGLKRTRLFERIAGGRVALRARAWIETGILPQPGQRVSVALRARAWIETLNIWLP